MNSIAKEEKVSEGSIRYQIKVKHLKKKVAGKPGAEREKGTTPNKRNLTDSVSLMGQAATRQEARSAAARGEGSAPIFFENHESLTNAGVLFLIPALLSQGLLKCKEVYNKFSDRNHYYSLVSVVLTLSIMALCRIRTPEELKQVKPGELGRLIGLDRVPEVKCLRKKIQVLSDIGKARDFNNLLIDHWYPDKEEGAFLYIDGHVRIYYGHKANLPKKFVSRQKLCLNATTEYWVNDASGMPVMMVMGELSEKIKVIIEDQIIPILKNTVLIGKKTEENLPLCTLIFDREAYEPAFFQRLWEKERIAVITYRKNVKDSWDESTFKTTKITVLNNTIDTQLCEQKVTLSDYDFREVRGLGKNGHQTSVITTHPSLSMAEIAGRMFARWSQENFFKYMMENYDLDRVVEYGIEDIAPQRDVVNPQYRRLTKQLKALRDKKRRLQAKFFPILDEVIEKNIDAIPELTQKQIQAREQIKQYDYEELKLVKERKQTSSRIMLKEMPEDRRFNKLKHESKLFMNVIKMIAYRSESALSNLLPNTLKGEQRMCIKQLIANDADVIPDYENKTLTVRLHAMSAPRFNCAIADICDFLNDTETIFPGTNLRMIFKTTALSVY